MFTPVSPVWNLFETECLIGKSAVDHEVEDLVEQDTYDTEQVGNTGWGRLKHWMHLLNSQWIEEPIASLPI